MPPEIDYAACMRYVRGEATLAEARAVRAWLANPANQQLAEQWMSRHAGSLAADAPAAADDPYDYAALRQSLRLRLDVTAAPPLTRPARSAPWRRWAAAAGLATAVLGAGWLWHQHQPAALATARYTTPYGQMRAVRLPDGSVVTLNAHSELRYAASADPRTPREVWLEGEAFFAVQHLPTSQPFVVHTASGVNVEVLGTRFTVYRRHAQARVVLLSGKVRVAFADSAQPAVLLKPGELLRISDQRPRLVEHRAVVATAYTDWTHNQLVFDATTLSDIAVRLEDAYGVPVMLDGATLPQRRFTGTFSLAKLDVLCENLAETFHLRVVREPHRLVFSPRAAPPARHRS